jgi:hypothetical protein
VVPVASSLRVNGREVGQPWRALVEGLLVVLLALAALCEFVGAVVVAGWLL